MTKLKLSLKNTAKPALLFNLAFCIFLILSGCQKNIEPSYKEDDIPDIVKRICKSEYNLDVITKRTNTTLWVYAPMSKMLHEDFGKQQDKIFDENIADKLRNILTTIGRVLTSSDNTPEFFVLWASDINLGIDYTVLSNVLDLKKSYAEFIPWTEANRRYVINFNAEPAAIGDVSGTHIKTYDITLPEFLAKQIAQRIGLLFQEDNLKKYFKVTKSEGEFKEGTFSFRYLAQEIAPLPKNIDTNSLILKVVSYCVHTYEFRDFSAIEITDLTTQNKTSFNKAAIWAEPTE